MCGSSVEVISLLEILNASIRGVGGGQYAMSCCAAIFDLDSGMVTFANAGHPFPYVCRRPENGEPGSGDQLRALVSRGTPLGGEEFVVSATTMELAPDDVVVFFSDSLVDQTNAGGVPYGDRRLQKVLRRRVRSAGPEACQVILRDAMSHYGEREVDDDINVIVVRLGAADERKRGPARPAPSVISSR
jgi:serine phosphatase RsbU (regulator of sigma subunit)